MSDNMVSRIAKILNQAERAEEGSPEREAFMERAMTLSAAHSIDLAVARAHTVKKERVEQPEQRSFKVGEIGVAANKNAHFADLMIAICDANDVQVTISGSSVYVFGNGMPSDLDMCERFFALLSVQMVQEADAGLRNGDNGEWRDDAPKTRRVEIPDDEREWGGRKAWVDHFGESAYYDNRDEEITVIDGKPKRWRWVEWGGGRGGYDYVESRQPPKYKNEPVLDDDGQPVMERRWVSLEDGRPWRANFYKGFVNRARYRLREAKDQALREAGIDVRDTSDDRAVALRDKEKEVKDFFEEENRFVLQNGRTHKGAQVGKHSWLGQDAGDRAGQHAVLGNERVVE